MSLKLITFARSVYFLGAGRVTAYILVAKMLQQFELSVGSLREDRSAKRLHDLFDRDRLARQLVLGRTVPHPSATRRTICRRAEAIPNQPKRSHSHRLQVSVSGCVSITIGGRMKARGLTGW